MPSDARAVGLLAYVLPGSALEWRSTILLGTSGFRLTWDLGSLRTCSELRKGHGLLAYVLPGPALQSRSIIWLDTFKLQAYVGFRELTGLGASAEPPSNVRRLAYI